MTFTILRPLAGARAAPTKRMNEDYWQRVFEAKATFLILGNFCGCSCASVKAWVLTTGLPGNPYNPLFWSPTSWVLSLFPCNNQYFIFFLSVDINHLLSCRRERTMSLAQSLGDSTWKFSKSLLQETMYPNIDLLIKASLLCVWSFFKRKEQILLALYVYYWNSKLCIYIDI